MPCHHQWILNLSPAIRSDVMNHGTKNQWPVISEGEFMDLIANVDWYMDERGDCGMYRRKHDGAELGGFDYRSARWRVNPEVFKAIKI